MAILINDNYSLSANKAFDARYLDVTTPWADCAAAIAGIPTYRYAGLTINIAGEEYWWKDGLTNGDLVLKALGGTSNLSGATNGLQLLCSNTYVGLGGILTQDTTICGAQTLNFGNSVSGLTGLCGVSPIFNVEDAGANSSISLLHNQDTPHFDITLYGENADSNAELVLNVNVNNGNFIVNTEPNSTCCSSLSLLTTDNNVAVYNVHSSNVDTHYVKEACIASSKLSCEIIINRSTPALNIKTVMNYDDRSHAFISDDSTILTILSGGTARYGSNVSLTDDCDLAHKYYVDNAIGSFSGSNGLTRVDNNITLGGTLTGNTVISGATNDFKIGTVVSPLGEFCTNSDTLSIAVVDGTVNSSFCADYCCVQLRNSDSSGGNTYAEMIGTRDDGFVFRFCNNAHAVEYHEDYSSLYNERTLPDVNYVTGLTSTSGVQSANNGLTKNGINVHLGGNLTGDTIINGLGSHDMSFNNINNLSLVSASDTTICGNHDILVRTSGLTIHNGVNNVMLITSTCNIFTDATNSEGFVYATNYCDIGKTNPRWIPDNEYVTGLTTGGVSTASNGLSLTGSDVHLGGSLTGNTDICLATYNFNIENSGVTTHTLAEFNPTTINLCASNVNSPFQISKLTANVSGTVICNGFANCYSALNMSNSLLGITICGGVSNASFIVTDNSTTPRGIEYTTDYSGTFSDCSLITKEYTDNCALITLNSGKTYTDIEISKLTGTTSQAITGATNGLTKTGQDVCLGGTLSEETTIIGNGQNLNLGTPAGGELNNITIVGTGTTSLIAGNIPTSEFSIIKTCNDSISMGLFDSPITSSAIDISSATFRITDTINNKGLEYAADYSGNYTCLSIPNVGWVTGQTSSSGIHSANNGLTKVGTNVKLGGTLTEQTIVNGNGQELTFGNVGNELFTFNTLTTGTTTNFAGNILGGDVSISRLSPTGFEYSTQNGSGEKIGINSDKSNFIAQDQINLKGLEYENDYSANFTARSIVDKEYIDNKSNTVAVCIIYNTYTTLRNDELIAVSGLSSNQINLYSTPVLGQRLTVVDICGNALGDPIVVNGNGNNINDDICSTINTDYGSVTYVYNGMFWSAVAFIN